MESKGISQSKTSKKGKYVELVKDSLQIIQPTAVPGIILRSFIHNISCVQYSSLVVTYHPYMDDMEGTLVINVYDTRHEDPAKALLYHTAFPVNKDQKIIYKLNRVMGPEEKKDVLAIEIKNIGVLAKEGTNFGKIKVKPSWNLAKKGLTGSIGTCVTIPPLTVIKGVDINPSRIGAITKGMEYIGCDGKKKEDLYI